MKSLTGLLALAFLSPAIAPCDRACGLAHGKQDKNIHDVAFQYQKAIKKISGVIDVSVAAVNGESRILVRVESQATKDAVDQLIGKKLDGFPVQVVIVPPKAKTAETEKPRESSSDEPAREQPPVEEPVKKSSVGQTMAEPRHPEHGVEKRPDLADPFEECDILRETLGRPPRKEGVTGRCAWVRRTVIQSPGAVARLVTVSGGNGAPTANGPQDPQQKQQGSGFGIQSGARSGTQGAGAGQGGTGQSGAGNGGSGQSGWGSNTQAATGQATGTYKSGFEQARKQSLEKNSIGAPKEIPGSTGWKRGAGFGVWATTYARHRKDCPIRLREAVDALMNGGTPK